MDEPIEDSLKVEKFNTTSNSNILLENNGKKLEEALKACGLNINDCTFYLAGSRAKTDQETMMHVKEHPESTDLDIWVMAPIESNQNKKKLKLKDSEGLVDVTLFKKDYPLNLELRIPNRDKEIAELEFKDRGNGDKKLCIKRFIEIKTNQNNNLINESLSFDDYKEAYEYEERRITNRLHQQKIEDILAQKAKELLSILEGLGSLLIKKNEEQKEDFDQFYDFYIEKSEFISTHINEFPKKFNINRILK
jgi:predicted nucleotidyltransferase